MLTASENIDAIRVLVTGSTGFVGSFLASELSRSGHEIYGVRRNGVVPAAMKECRIVSGDIGDAGFCRELLTATSPDMILHCAALSSIEGCETDPLEAWRVNVGSVRQLVKSLNSTPTDSPPLFIFLSTDLVFDGTSAPEGGHRESDLPQPVTVYARTKVEAEHYLADYYAHAIVLRISLVYGPATGVAAGSLGWLARALQGRKEVSLFTDEHRTPLYLPDLTDFIEFLYLNRASFLQSESRRILHVAGPERISRYEFALHYAKEFGYDPNFIRPVKQREVASLYPRTPDAALNTDLVRQLYRRGFTGVGDGLANLRERNSR